jgi:hypothetical protein
MTLTPAPRFICALAALIALLGCTEKDAPPPAAPSPERAVKIFYDGRIASRMTGAPSATQLASMKPYVSGELHALLAQARTRYESDLARAPGEMPAFAEGDLFSSLFDGPTSFSIGDVETDGAAHIVPVRFVSAKRLPAVNWIDRVRVVQENGVYVIADVEYGNHWSFGAKGTLLQSLKEATSQSGKRRD